MMTTMEINESGNENRTSSIVPLTLIPQVQVLHVGPIEMQVLASISLLLFDVSLVLNLPIINLFLNHTLGYTMQKKKQMRFLKHIM